MGAAHRHRRRLGHRLRQCGAASGPASRRLRRVAAPGDAGRASLCRRRHPAMPPRWPMPFARRPAARRCGQGAQPRRRPLALSCDRARPRIVGGVGAEYPQWLLAAAAVFRRHPRGRTDHASRHHPGAEPDRSRFPHQPGSAAPLPGAGDPRQPLSAAVPQHRLGGDRLHRRRCAAGSLGVDASSGSMAARSAAGCCRRW